MDLVNIGVIRKPHGIKGALKLRVKPAYLEDILQAESVFVEEKGIFLPYFIENIQLGKELLVWFESIQSRTDVEHLSGCPIALRKMDLLSDEDRMPETDSLQYSYLMGYQIEDKTLGTVGVIEEVVEMPQQEMAVILVDGKEVLIPLHEDLMLAIDEGAKKIVMDLPEGLVDL